MATLPTADKDRIDLYMNYDMVGSPNPGYFVYDDNAAGNGARDSTDRLLHVEGHPLGVHRRAGPLRPRVLPQLRDRDHRDVLRRRGHRRPRPRRRSGAAPRGRAFDPCYHRSCDTISNINTTALDRNIDMIGHMVWLYADKDYGTTTPPTTTPGGNLLANPGFESGAVSWAGTSGPITNNTGRPARTGIVEGAGSAATAARRRRTSRSR